MHLRAISSKVRWVLLCVFVTILSAAVIAQAQNSGDETKPLVVTESNKDLGKQIADDLVTIEYDLKNQGKKPLRVIGFRVGCACTSPGRLPLTLDPNESKPFKVKFRVPKEPGRTTVKFLLFTNVKTQRDVEFSVSVEAVEKSKKPNKS